MHLSKPYLHLSETDQGDFNLHILVALPHGLKLGTPVITTNRGSSTREITVPVEKQNAQVYFGPVELVVPISNADKTASGETTIQVKLGDNTNPEPALQLKGTTTISYGDSALGSRGGGKTMPDMDTWDADS